MATTRQGNWWVRHDERPIDVHHRRKNRRRGADRPDRGLRPGLDALEPRVTPTTFTPTTISDLPTAGQTLLETSDVNETTGGIISQGGKVTLRSAIIAADEDGGSNTIDLPAGTYQLTLTPPSGSNGTDGGNGVPDGENGELPVTSALTITGAGSASTIVGAGTSATNGISKVFSFNPLGESNGFAVKLTGLTIQFGKNNSTDDTGDGEGGAFDFDAGPDGLGSLTMSDVVVNQNSTINGDGGGIALFDGGVVSITNSKFTNNTANGVTGGGTGGGIYIGGYYDGTVPSTTKLTITGSTISGNVTAGAAGEDGGGILSDANFPVVINSSTISGNKTGTSQHVNGGGIADEGSGGLTIDQDTAISGNSATHWGGGLYSTDTASITDTTIINNFAAGGVSSQSNSVNEGGGGIFADESSAAITITDSRIVGNTATVGGSQLDGDGGASGGGVLNAANNWFGTNSPSASFFGAGVKTLTTTPFLVMTFSAAPTSLVSGSTSTLSSAVTKNSANTTGFSIPDGTPATFSGGTIGSVNPSSTTTTSGMATSTFTAGSSPGTGNVSATIDNQTLTFQISVAAGVPTANAQSVSVAFDTAMAITLTGSDPDTPPLALTYAVATNPADGTLSGTAPNLTYTPNAGYHGSDSFTFKVSNGINISAAATVSLTVAAGVPTANAQSVNVAFNTATAVTLTGSDPDSPPLTLNYAVIANPGHGSLSGTAPNLTYTPNAGYHGSDSFTFKVSNGINISAAATVSLTVAAGVPTASSQSVNVAFNTATAVTLTGSDPDSPPLTLNYAVIANPGHGSLSGTAPNLTYTPNTGFHGSDSFTFKVTNGLNISAAATVTLNVAAGVPTANPQSVTLNENSATSVTLTGSDPDVPALPLTYAIVAGQGPADGTISNFIPATGALTYTPNANYFGADSFQFTVSNGVNTSAPATVSLTINQVQATVSGTVGVSWGTAGTATLQTNADGLRLLPAGRTTDLPWYGINKLQITLSQPETLLPSDVFVAGITVPSYSVTISGSGTNYTIKLTPAITTADRVTVTIGSAGIATYTRRLDVLPGDVNDDGVVNAQDLVAVEQQWLGVVTPTIFGDITGDGTPSEADYLAVRQRIGTKLPPV